MAYLFSRLNETLNNQQTGRSSDVIGQQASAPAGPAQADRETPRPGGLNSQSSAVIGGGQASAQPAAANEAATAVNSESRAKVFQKNKGAELTADTSGTSNAIAQTQADLQKEANKYVGEQKYSQVGDEVVSNAVKQADDGADDRAAIQSLLYGAAKPVDAFAFNDKSLDGARTQVTGMNTTAGRQAMIQERGNSTSGEARLDAALLGKSGAYQKQQADVIGQFGALKSVQDAEGKRAGQAVEQVGREREGDKDRVRAALERLRTGATDADFAAFREENNARQGLNDKARATAAAVRAEMLKGAQFADSAGMAGVTNRAELDKMFDDPRLAKYLTAGAQLDKYTSADGAAQFNRINELLMQGDRRSAVGSLAGRGGFDEAGYRAELARMLQERAPRLAPIPAGVTGESGGAGAGGSIIPGSVDRGVEAVEVVKKAARDIDPTSKDSYTNPVTGGWNTVRDMTLKPAAQVVTAPVKKPIAKAKAVPKKLGNEGTVGPKKEEPKKKEGVLEKGVSEAKKFFGL